MSSPPWREYVRTGINKLGPLMLHDGETNLMNDRIKMCFEFLEKKKNYEIIPTA